MFDHHEQQLTTTPLTATEASGGICSSYFGDRRQHQVPADWPSPILRFMAPSTGPNPRPAFRSVRPLASSRPAPSRFRRGDSPLAAA